MPGHSSATMALDTHGHLFENRLDEVADAMDPARTNQRRAAGLDNRAANPDRIAG
jgi:hypothetical protein